MAGIGAGYDLSVSTFSPDGRVFQVEYAGKAVDNGSASVAIVCKDGILFAVEKLVTSKMALPESNSRIFAVDYHVTIAVGGFLADGREIVNRARLEAKEYKRVYDEPIPGKVLSERLALFVHAYTLAWSERPFGAAILLGVYEEGNLDAEGPKLSLYSIETTGTCYKYFGTAIGKGRQSAKTEIEKLDLKSLTVQDSILKMSKIMLQIHGEGGERTTEIEMAQISESSGWKHQLIPKEIVDEARKEAQRILDEDVDMSVSA